LTSAGIIFPFVLYFHYNIFIVIVKENLELKFYFT
jgi:hypothetical protein